uniref:Uncharacterized protein n=1 Tax=Octopus bimaculoides TaxID=37653 RepID=A0A0L8G1Q1_OCTBM
MLIIISCCWDELFQTITLIFSICLTTIWNGLIIVAQDGFKLINLLIWGLLARQCSLIAHLIK